MTQEFTEHANFALDINMTDQYLKMVKGNRSEYDKIKGFFQQ